MNLTAMRLPRDGDQRAEERWVRNVLGSVRVSCSQIDNGESGVGDNEGEGLAEIGDCNNRVTNAAQSVRRAVSLQVTKQSCGSHGYSKPHRVPELNAMVPRAYRIFECTENMHENDTLFLRRRDMPQEYEALVGTHRECALS